MASEMPQKFEFTNRPLHQYFFGEYVGHFFDRYLAISRSICGWDYINCQAYCPVQTFTQDLDDLVALIDCEVDPIGGIKHMRLFQCRIAHCWQCSHAHRIRGNTQHLPKKNLEGKRSGCEI